MAQYAEVVFLVIIEPYGLQNNENDQHSASKLIFTRRTDARDVATGAT